MTEQESRGFLQEERREKTVLEGGWVREKLKNREDNAMKQAMSEERVNLEPTRVRRGVAQGYEITISSPSNQTTYAC